jgi:hypothetical protein
VDLPVTSGTQQRGRPVVPAAGAGDQMMDGEAFDRPFAQLAAAVGASPGAVSSDPAALFVGFVGGVGCDGLLFARAA